MSTKTKVAVDFALAAMSIETVSADGPIVEGLLNDRLINGLYIAQVDDLGRCVMVVDVGVADTSEYRLVASAAGDVKLYSGFAAASVTVARAQLALGAEVTYLRKDKVGALGDPVVILKRNYKAFKAEKVSGEKYATDIAAKILAAESLGWQNAVNTMEAAEYADYVAKRKSIKEWTDFSAARIASLAASLTASGVDPVTVV